MNEENLFNDYQDPIATPNNEPVKKKVSKSATLSGIASFLCFYLFGVLGGLIFTLAFVAIYKICKSSMHIAFKILLSILIGFVALVLYLFILAAIR